jgi:DNA repair exonuclease SbcCD ATPase subunit
MPQDGDGTDLRDLTIEELQATRNQMLRFANKEAAKAAGEQTYKDYNSTLNAIQDAVRDLRNAELLALLQQLRAHESDLREGIKDLERSRENIERVEQFLVAAGKVLEVVGKVLKAVA